MPAIHVRHIGSDLIVEGTGEIDPYLLTALLRHRPKELLPFTLIRGGNSARFLFDVSGLESLGYYVRRHGRSISGKKLLAQLLDVMQAAKDAMLWPDPALLTPGLVFLTKNTGHVRILALPLPVDDADGLLLPIFRALEKTDDFDNETGLHLRALLEQNRFSEAADLVRPSLPLPLSPSSPKRTLRQHMLAIQHALADRIRSMQRNPADRSFEATAPVEPIEALPIGIISEGLPGTEAEERGEKAFILVDEFIFGRDVRKVDFHLDDDTCGRIHARILRRRNLFFLEDLGSKNGTYLDGQRLQKYRETMLPEQAKLRFGQRVYFFTSE